MGNRTFLSVTNANAKSIEYEHIAFETNNFLAPIWFCLVGREQFQRYGERLMEAWSKIQPHMDEPDVETFPEWESFSDAFEWQIPWLEAVEQMRLSLPRTLARYPMLAAPVQEWLNTLSTHVRLYPEPVIHLELSQYFSFTGDPALYLKDIEEYVSLCQSPHPSQAKVWQGAAESGYKLGGEHLPWREHKAVQAEQVLETKAAQSDPPTSVKRPSKLLQEFYIWLLAILLAALFLIVYFKTSSFWLAALAFLVPLSVPVLWHILFERPGKTSSHRPKSDALLERNNSLSINVFGMEHFDGNSLIGADGLQTGSAEDPSIPALIPWPQITQAQGISSHEIVLTISADHPPIPVAPIHLRLNGQLSAKDAASAINAIALAYKMAASAHDQ
ncbi:hypothetical protein [Paenibacillus sp. GCM10027626]|uniref:hypothetical protein n=1 Tax=Paenibacillus sp. GCM10027626 TaxID=3273411 RepID=UPI00362BEBEA